MQYIGRLSCVFSGGLHFREEHAGTYRPELWHIPTEVFCSMHHLSNNPIHFLLVEKVIKHLCQYSRAVGSDINSSLQSHFLKNLQSCQGLRCRLCRRAWKQLKWGEMKVEVLVQVITLIIFEQEWNKWLTLQFIPGLAILQQREVTWNILQEDFFYGIEGGKREKERRGGREYYGYHSCTHTTAQACGDKWMYAK